MSVRMVVLEKEVEKIRERLHTRDNDVMVLVGKVELLWESRNVHRKS